MDYSKEMLIKEAIKKLDTIDELVESYQNLMHGIYAEKETASYLLYLACKKEKN